MKTTAAWNRDILEITRDINQKYPELSKFIKEIPQNIVSKSSESITVASLEDYHNSLEELRSKYSKTHVRNDEKMKKKSKFPDYPQYAPAEDIYNQSKKEIDLDPNDLSKKKSRNQKQGLTNEKNFEEDMPGGDLDVPGSELDNQQESVGSEDEENNYYSIGGDNHIDLEENNA